MKRNKILKRLIPIIVILLIVQIVFRISSKEIWEVNKEKLQQSFNLISGDEIIYDLSQWTPFEWDTVYSFTPYTSKEKIYEIIGYKWDNIEESMSEDIEQIVFLKDDKVVCYLFGRPKNLKLGFNFGITYESYIMLLAEDKLTFDTTYDEEQGVRFLYYKER